MTITIAAIGCSGPVASVYIQGFLAHQTEDVRIRLLTRRPKEFPEGVELVLGSMMNPDDVASAMEGVDAAFVLTPMSTCNQTQPEVDAAKAVIAGAQKAQLKHLIYTSVLGADHPRPRVGILNAKYEIETLLRHSNLSCSILRCGTYMQDAIDPRIELLNKGIYLFPIRKDARICYTCQKDVSRFVLQELLIPHKILSKPLNFTRAQSYSVAQVEDCLSAASGHTIRAVPKFPAFYLFQAALPIYNWQHHRFSSVIPLLVHFDQHGYTCDDDDDDDPDTTTTTASLVEETFPHFSMTTLEEHLASLWAQ
ncbi:NmrA-like family [Seminavis robusta]|uniref:NmrA-like family n=1 Tax=Seminavis robusta TaxID=568900 RepID=A0A9N8DI58_9STRA|nr:NmrA-like family [Seminavis robusta]|eukprot:Sro165_g073810.1 NmrA-like family (309) ;mRNA; r:31807-32733